jgi:hypothetical protein
MHATYNDSRDVIRDFTELEEGRAEYAELLEALPEEVSDEAKEMLMQHTDWSPEQETEWQELKEACEAGEDFPDWDSGTQLIPEHEFNGDFAEEMCRDLGYLPIGGLPAFIVVDWNATADNLKADYSTITICDEEYYISS